MVFSDWRYFTKKYIEVDDVYGVYQLSTDKKEKSHIRYIGYGRLRSDLMKYVLGDRCKSPSMYFRYEITHDEEQAEKKAELLLRDYKESYGRLPKCNTGDV